MLITTLQPRVTGDRGAERLIAQHRVYHKRKGICENNRGAENVTVWYVSKIVATGGRSTPRESIYNKGGGLATRLYTSLGLAALHYPPLLAENSWSRTEEKRKEKRNHDPPKLGQSDS